MSDTGAIGKWGRDQGYPGSGFVQALPLPESGSARVDALALLNTLKVGMRTSCNHEPWRGGRGNCCL